MVRFAFVLIGTLLVIQPTSTVRRLTGECERSCPDDDQDGRCPAGCVDCSCSGNPTPLISKPTPFNPPLPAPLRASLVSSEDLPRSADPQELLRVPKLLHA